jgi:hypothetical protein
MERGSSIVLLSRSILSKLPVKKYCNQFAKTLFI